MTDADAKVWRYTFKPHSDFSLLVRDESIGQASSSRESGSTRREKISPLSQRVERFCPAPR